MEPSLLGAYGPWAAQLAGDGPGRVSFRNSRYQDLGAWQSLARERFAARLLQPETGGVPSPRVVEQGERDGLHVEQLRWQLPYGPPTEAYFLKPAGAAGPLPGVLALHDHGANKYFGARKIVRNGPPPHPMMVRHQQTYYGGVGWADELARRGYAVLVHDAFAFGSRRVRAADLPAVAALSTPDPLTESEAEIAAYNALASEHEHILAKGLFCAGTTWPGVFTGEDQRALDYLASRSDVDPTHIGCAGLSGGGLRTVYLSALDDRIRCACCVGMMTTWRDFLLNTSYTHTWMIYIPGLPLEMDYPEIFGLRVPVPVLVQNNAEDELFTVDEMSRADRILAEVYHKAGATERYRCTFYPGPHKFDRPMQAEAFDWLDRWLKS